MHIGSGYTHQKTTHHVQTIRKKNERISLSPQNNVVFFFDDVFLSLVGICNGNEHE